MTAKPLVEQLRARAAGFDDAHARSQNGDYAAHAELDREAADAITDLTASRDRHERDEETFRARWIEEQGKANGC